MTRAEIGVIGGSGLYDIEGMSNVQYLDVDTPFGKPSDTLVVGNLEGVSVAFLPRHRRGHGLLPSELPSRANMYALRELGVTQIIAASAVGSLRETLRPMDMVVPDQLFDRTKDRPSTFFGEGIVAHIPFAEPFCSGVAGALEEASGAVVERTHRGGTYVCIEGPAFSTFAESTTYRHLGFDVIGMTALPEAKLAREAQMCYAILAQVTDYDCWRQDEETVTSDMVMENVARNATNAKAIIRRVVPRLSGRSDCSCRHALEGAVVTSREAMPLVTRERLRLLLEGSPSPTS